MPLPWGVTPLTNRQRDEPGQLVTAALAHHRPRHPSPAPVLGHLQGGHYVYLFALTRPVQLTALLGPNGAHLTAGYGKWEEVPVPRGIPFTQWNGRSLWTMDLDLMLDGWGEDRSVEPDITALEYMALRPGKEPVAQPRVTPPPIRITGPMPHPEFTWVVTGIDLRGSSPRLHLPVSACDKGSPFTYSSTWTKPPCQRCPRRHRHRASTKW